MNTDSPYRQRFEVAAPILVVEVEIPKVEPLEYGILSPDDLRYFVARVEYLGEKLTEELAKAPQDQFYIAFLGRERLKYSSPLVRDEADETAVAA